MSDLWWLRLGEEESRVQMAVSRMESRVMVSSKRGDINADED